MSPFTDSGSHLGLVYWLVLEVGWGIRLGFRVIFEIKVGTRARGYRGIGDFKMRGTVHSCCCRPTVTLESSLSVC